MSLQFDADTGKIIYRGKEVGEHSFSGGRSTVRLTIEYEAGDDWVVPLSWFAVGLNRLTENKLPDPLLTVITSQDSIAEEFDVLRSLIEVTVKQNGYVWRFHKSDADDWPSPLHGHDYDERLKIDAITGDVYDVGTRTLCKRLKTSDLRIVQDKLRASKDFATAVERLIDAPSAATGSASQPQ